MKLTDITEHSDFIHNLPLMTMSQRWNLHRARVNFGKQPLELWMFFPCKFVDGIWVVFEEPNTEGFDLDDMYDWNLYDEDCKEY